MRLVRATLVVWVLVFACLATTANAAEPSVRSAADALSLTWPPASALAPGLHQHGVRLGVDPRLTSPGGSVEATVINHADQTVDYGLEYSIARWDRGRWQKTDLAPDIFPMILLRLPGGQRGVPQTIKLPTDVELGIYRVTKRVQEEDTNTTTKVHGWFVVT